MPAVHITVTAVSDEGDTVVVWARLADPLDAIEPVGFVFEVKGQRSARDLAERASRLRPGANVTIEYTPVADGWNIARGLSVP